MRLQKYQIDGDQYAFYTKTLFRVLDSVEHPDHETPYYIEIGDMSRAEGAMEEDMVVQFREHDVLSETARIICAPDGSYEFGLIHLDGIETIREVTEVEPVDEFST